MEKSELITKLQALRKELKEKQIEQIKLTLKDTSTIGKLKREIASILTKLSTIQHGA
jgi:ribosomal protein L29